MRSSWEDLKRRKIVQWTLAYLAAAWLSLDVTSLLGGHLGWPNWVHRVLIVVAAVGLPITLVVAWYHGEKGRQRVSGTELVLIGGLLGVAALSVSIVARDTASEPSEDGRASVRGEVEERSIAVLPLTSLGPEGDEDWFARALTGEIASALAEVPGLQVTSRSSSERFDATETTVSEFAERIGVAHVLEGSVQQLDDGLRVRVNLVDAMNDRTLWSRTFEIQIADVFGMQVEIAREVARELATRFTEAAEERILATATDDPVAYDLLLRSRSGRTSSDERIELLRRAVTLDPGFWPAWSDLARVYRAREIGGEGEYADSARIAFERAIEVVDDESARLRLEAFRDLSFGEMSDETLARLRTLADQRPSDLTLARTLSELLRVRGDLPGAARYAGRVTQLDPLDANAWTELWYPLYWMGIYDEGEAALRRAIDLAPGSGMGWWLLAYHFTAQGSTEDALAAADSLEARGTGPATGAIVHWFAGDLERAAQRFPDSPVGLDAIPAVLVPGAAIHFAVGDSASGRRLRDQAHELLEARRLGDYLPEPLIWPRLQLAVLAGDMDGAVEWFDRYVETGGRDWRWLRRSPLFTDALEHPAFRTRYDDLRNLVEDMRSEVVATRQ